MQNLYLFEPEKWCEWIMYKTHHSKGASIFKVEGAVEVEIDTATGSGSWEDSFFM